MLESEVFFLPNILLSKLDVRGEGMKKMLIIARSEDIDTGKETFGKIIKAIGYDIDQDCYILALGADKAKKDLAPLLRELDITDLIVFGVNPKELGFHIQARLYYPFQFEQMSFILSHSIAEMNDNQKFKMALWQCLQKQFLQG